MKKIYSIIVSLLLIQLVGCASVEMSSSKDDEQYKQFQKPNENEVGLYVYRKPTIFGAALKKDLYLDGQCFGETARGTYFYLKTTPGMHVVSTESEFSENHIKSNFKGGKNYFIEQNIKIGVFAGGASLIPRSEKKGQEDVQKCKLAKIGNKISHTIAYTIGNIDEVDFPEDEIEKSPTPEIEVNNVKPNY